MCIGCALGKNVKGMFSRSDNREEGTLRIVHLDVCGKISTPSLSKYLYYVTFIDDFSQNTCICFLKTKDEIFSKFKEFKALVENLSKRKNKVHRLDKSG